MTQIRIIGLPSTVERVVAELSRALAVQSVSDPRPCRKARDRGKVRVYVEVR